MKNEFKNFQEAAENVSRIANSLSNRWILQTYFIWHGVEERGFNREFATLAEAQDYARNHLCGSRHTIEIKGGTFGT